MCTTHCRSSQDTLLLSLVFVSSFVGQVTCVLKFAVSCNLDGRNHEDVCGKEREISLPLPPGSVATTCTLVLYLTVRVYTFGNLHGNTTTIIEHLDTCRNSTYLPEL